MDTFVRFALFQPKRLKEEKMSALLTGILIVEYLIIGIVCALEGQYAKALYWFGAIILTAGVLLMRG